MKVGSPGFIAFIGGSKANKTPEGHSGRVASVPREFSFLECPRGGMEKEVKAMPPQELAFAAPGTEEMMEVGVGGGSAVITGVVEGVVVKMAPQMGAAAPILSWGTLLGVPTLGVAGALFTRGLISDVCKGIATGGLAILGYSLPAMLAPEMFGRKTTKLTAEQLAALAAGKDVKQLTTGLLNAPQRAQAQVSVGLGYE